MGMALTPEETAYVAELERSVDDLKHIVFVTARRLLAQRRNVELKRKDELFVKTFGKETTDNSAAKQLRINLDRIDVFIERIFDTGMVGATKEEIEETLAPLPRQVRIAKEEAEESPSPPPEDN